jgi:Stress responsive A/B Barrel Domain
MGTLLQPLHGTIWKNINRFVTFKDVLMSIRHLVLVKFKAETAPARLQSLETAFAALASKISAVQSLEWGTNNSPEGLDKGFTHCFNLSFADEAARAAYLPHPEHLAFVEQLKPALDDVLVLDYTV